MQHLKEVIDFIGNAIKPDANNLLLGGGIIADGFDEEIDQARDFVNNAHNWLNNYTAELIQNTQILTLKIKFTQASGYFIEIPLSQKSKIPEYFIHISTLVNASRFTTVELQAFDEKISNGESFLYQKEYEIFQKVSQQIYSFFPKLKQNSFHISEIDYFSNLAYVAKDNNYVLPEIHTGYDLEIIGGRHPIVEKIEPNFIQNEVFLDKNIFTHIITGPNMGGKSTYLRQNALIILLSHIGSFVPATRAKIPITDKIFSRVGASDNLFAGASTFMVEMQEVSNILHNATEKSFVIIDEVGRGTSTYDGMSLAWAILKHIHNKIKAKTLFATHYHELVINAKNFSGVANFSVAVGENEDNIVFLRKIIPGSIKKSYGIEVAKLAGLPTEVIHEANNFLQTFTKEQTFSQLSLGNIGYIENEKKQYKEKKCEIEEKIKSIDIYNLTPLQALNVLYDFKKKLDKK